MIIHKFKDKIKTFSTVIKKGPRIEMPIARPIESRISGNILATNLVNKIVAGVKFDLDSCETHRLK